MPTRIFLIFAVLSLVVATYAAYLSIAPSILLPVRIEGSNSIDIRPIRRILSFNTKLLPFPTNLASDCRAYALSKWIMDDTHDVDVVCLQEMFSPHNARKVMLSFRDRGWFVERSLSRNDSVMTGGLMVASRYPIEIIERVVFDKCQSVDCFSSKGALLVRTSDLLLFATHLQADYRDNDIDPVRKSQFDRAIECAERSVGANEACVLIGDFNIEASVARSLLPDDTVWSVVTPSETSIDFAISNDVIALDVEIPPYLNDVSDHLPVLFTRSSNFVR